VTEPAGQLDAQRWVDGVVAGVAGGVRGVDQVAQCFGYLDGPVRGRVALGRVGQVSQDVRGTQLVDQVAEHRRVVVLVPVVHDHPGQVGQAEVFEGGQGPVAQVVPGVVGGAGDQQVLLGPAGADPYRGLVAAHRVRRADQRADELVDGEQTLRGAGQQPVHPARARRCAGQRCHQLHTPLYRDCVHHHQVHAPALQVRPVRHRCVGQAVGPVGDVDPPADAAHRVQVVLGAGGAHLRDLVLLVRTGNPQVGPVSKVCPAPARALREVRHRLVRLRPPRQMHPRRARLLTPLALATPTGRLVRRRRPPGQVVGARRHRRVPRVAAQPPLQLRHPCCQRNSLCLQLLDHLSLGGHQREQLLARQLLQPR